MKMTVQFESEMDYVKDLLTVLRMNRCRRGDVFVQRKLMGQPRFGEPRNIDDLWATCTETLDAMERRGLITPVNKIFTWGDGTEVTMENMRAGEVYQTTTYRVVIDNIEDYFVMLADNI